MNCNEAQLNILLRDSGELPSNQQKDLDIHLNSCKECSQYSKTNQEIMDLAIQNMPDDGPSAGILENISLQAEPIPRRPLIFRRHIIQWAAAAALVLIVLGNWTLTTPPGAGKTEISDMYAILALVTDNAYSSDAPQTDELPGMEDLLLQIEDASDNYELTEEELWAPQPISPQSYNTRAIPQKIYG